MPKSTLYYEPASRLAKDTRRELEALLSQRKILSRRIKRIKRTLNGLCELFSLGAPPDCISPSNHRQGLPERKAGMLEPLLRPVPRSSASLRCRRNESADPKLERACRVALLESEEATSATGIYDRIVRRGSYRLNRYQHPLVHIMKALDGLASRNEVEMIAGKGHPCWVLRPKLSDSEGYEFTIPPVESREKTDCSKLIVPKTHRTLHNDGSSPSREFEPSSTAQVSL